MPDVPAASRLFGHRILVVEDEFLIAEDLRAQLVLAGAEVIGPAPSLPKAFALLDAGVAPDSAILDVNLCGQKVFPLADALQARGIPCVFVTGYDRSTIPAAYAHIGICQKPATVCEIARALALAAAYR